jgi:Winged helix DNA-binding domain
LARRQFLAVPATELHDVVSDLVGLHATDPATPYLSLYARLPGFAVPHLDAALYERRSAVKHLAMRRTLWVVGTDYLPQVQAAASDRVAENERRKLIGDVQKAGIAGDGERWLESACQAVLRHLAENGPTSAKELRAALPELTGTYDPAPGKRWGGNTPLSPRVLTVLSARGEIVRGPNEGTWTTSRPRWAAAADWLTERRDDVTLEAARAQLVSKYLRTFGPATVTDIKWWFGNTLTWARQALRYIDAVEVNLGGTPGFALPDDLDEETAADPWGALLPGLDPTTMGWFDRGWYLGEHRSHVFDTNGNAGPTALWNGVVVGGWVQDADGRVELRLLDDVGRDGRAALTLQADALTEWLDGVRISPRFPSPLTRGGK